MDVDDSRANQVADLLIQIYEIHEAILQESGGIPGLRDGAMLHSASARPFGTFAGEDLYPTDFDKAAALFHSLIKSHPFMDGTKRTAFAGTLDFLSRQGYHIPHIVPKQEVIDFCISIAEENQLISKGLISQTKALDEIAEWFRNLLGY